MIDNFKNTFERLLIIPDFQEKVIEFRQRLGIPSTGFENTSSEEYKNWIISATKKKDFIKETFLFIAKRGRNLNPHDEPIPFTVLSYFILFNSLPTENTSNKNEPLFSISPSGILGSFDVTFTLPVNFLIESFNEEVQKHISEIEELSQHSRDIIASLASSDKLDMTPQKHDFLSTTPGNGADIVDRVHRDIIYLVEFGRIVLREHLNNMPEADFAIKDYNDKNKPMLQPIQQMGSFLLNRNLFPIAEEYWKQIDEEITEFNKRTGKRVNRGIPLANQGVAQVAQGKVIEGLFNIYKAHEDDRVCLQHLSGISIEPEKDMAKSSLYTQFEDVQIDNVFNTVVSKYNNVFNTSISKTDLSSFVTNLNSDKKLLFYITLYRFSFSFNLNNELTNLISRSEILRSLSELALWFEDELKRKDPTLVGLTLIPILDNKMKSALNPVRGQYTNANSLTDLSTKISNAIGAGATLEMTNARIMGCLRNFAGHNLEVQNHVFFRSSGEIFARMLSFILYSKTKGWI